MADYPSLRDWQTRKMREMRESRDIIEIARKAAHDDVATRASVFQSKFNAVFGFEPELGEPESVESGEAYWVQGFLFTSNNVIEGPHPLYVRTRTGAWTGLNTPARFDKLLATNTIEVADYARD